MTQEKRFFIWEAIGEGFQIMKRNVWQLLGLQLAFFALYALLYFVIGMLLPAKKEGVSQLANTAVTWLVNDCFMLGVLTLSLKLADGMTVTFNDFFKNMRLVLIYFAASILASLAIILGLILLIVPGIIIMQRFSLFGFCIIDRGLGPIASLKESWHLVKGVTWRMFGFWLAYALVLLLGLLCLGVGLLFAFPTVSIASALVYRWLWNQTNITVES